MLVVSSVIQPKINFNPRTGPASGLWPALLILFSGCYNGVQENKMKIKGKKLPLLLFVVGLTEDEGCFYCHTLKNE